MEKDLKKIKDQMHNEELAGFVFTNEMKRNVISKIEMKNKGKGGILKVKKWIPVAITAAFLIVSSAGIYKLTAMDSPPQNAGPSVETPPVEKEEKKPELISPAYIPEGYIFKHTRTKDEVYEHVYVNEANQEEFFSYRMQKDEPDFNTASSNNIPLASNLLGSKFEAEELHTALVWEDEGYYQIVEQGGAMSEVDLLKIVDSIITEKGYESYLKEDIAELEAQLEEENQESEPGTTQHEDQENDAAVEGEDKVIEQETTGPSITESEAINLLKKFYETEDKVLRDFGDEYKHQSYQTKEQFYQEFTGFMKRDLIEKLYHYRLEERGDGLYHLPMDGFVVFQEGKPYQFEKEENGQYSLTQSYDSDLHGKGTFQATFSYQNGEWIISDHGSL
ncbi:DUF4367 domain-containing protein [Bacillus sp. ISL-47]|uniref:DUF4367 domain-containing protein n=1 Tax=Bacillus sp. ISL-47 TaxID=2819130 RepID=UPI001BE9E28F|nr:DUF4367 domain-containing protein [Bacillus sp. ISL-47]MBT2690570.1 DUF4367 domain-containing protein [Bacillus sp. ISL-47]MBT2710907.1 DUF4367 domain-containing protein [Pseudomonas sp. ISL-84]